MLDTGTVAWAGLPLAWAAEVMDMGLFRMVAVAPGLEQGGGEAKGCWKGDEAEGEGLGWGAGWLAGGLDFWAGNTSFRLSVL